MTAPNHTTENRTALVSGATGFIGGHLVLALLQSGYAVRALIRDRNSYAAPPGTEIFEGDLLRPESLAGIEKGVDVVVHCASLLGKWGSDPALLHEVNVGGAVHLLERFDGGGLHRFVHLSAGGVTGPAKRNAVDESYDCRPATPYEKTKLEGERRVLEISRERRIPATVVRPTFTYGPGDPHKLALFRAIKKGRYAFIGDGLSVNHPVYIDDLIRGILLTIDRSSPGEVYIIGGKAPVTKRELVFTIADLLRVRRPSFRIPRWFATLTALKLEALGWLTGIEPILTRSRVMMMADNFGYSIEKARRELGYEPRVELREGIENTINSYVESGRL